MKIFIKLFFLVVIIISTFFAAWFAIHRDIVFHSDIARDFLLMEDIFRHKPITLIGPRSGGIPGVFHGPLWIYLNMPAFILGNGNPVVVSWFWVILYLINLLIIYRVGKLMISKEVGWLATSLTAVITAFSIPGLFNPFGAVMIAPLFFYFLFQYIKEGAAKNLILSALFLGIMIQFQMAFGVPILILFIPLVIFILIRNKKFTHFFSLLIILIPLSTFILFDLRHQFLQTKSVINYLTGKENTGKVDKTFTDILIIRIKSIIYDGPGFITKDNRWLLYTTLFIFILSFFRSIKDKKKKNIRLFYTLFLYFYLGYWLLTIFYKGVMWGYYYWPFLGLVVLVFSCIVLTIDRRIFYFIFLVLIVFNLHKEYQTNFKPSNYFGQDGSSWQFHYKVAKTIYDDAPAEFGYYVFTADQFGYSSRYAMNYTQEKYKNKKAYPYEKKEVTYLLIASSDNSTISDDWWKREKVKIQKKPDKTFQFKGNNFRIEKYYLSSEEIKEKSDENLIHTLIFR